MAEGSSDSLVKDAIVSVLYDTSGPQVNVKGISEDLVRENVIDGNLEQHILSQQTDSDSLHILAQHLHNYGTLESVKQLCRVLRRTANRYHSHASVAEKLEKACGFSLLTAHSHEKRISHTSGELHDSEMSEEEIIEVFWRASLQLKEYYEKLPPVPFQPYRPTLDFIELAVINRGQERIKNESQVNTFLHATLRGINAIHNRLKSIKYAEILKFDKKRSTTGRRIVISGAPGCGKSTLSRQLCKDLSSGTLRNTYQLVILVELRELVYRMKEGEQLGLKHLLMKYPYLNSKKVFNALLCGYGKHVLFILDGYDELDESLRSCQFLRDILSTYTHSHLLSECDVVITTQPVTSGELFGLVQNPYRNVEILGFTEEHIHVYIDKYFENLENGQVKATKLKEKLEQLPHVRGMCRVPIVLEFVCKVHHILGDQGIPGTQTGIYGTYIVAELFNSKPVSSNSKPHSQVSLQDLLIVSEEDFPGFYELCRKAFECCSSTKGQRLLLTEQDVSNLTQYLNRGSIYGLLFAEVVESVCGSVRLFHYLHKSIQEMLAAVHIAKLPDEKHAPLWREQFGRPEMAEIWKYYAGITELKKLDTNTLLNLFKKTKKDQKILLMLSLYEANNQEVTEKVLPIMFSKNKISITARSSYEIVAANYFIKHHPSLASFKLELIGRRPPIKFGEPLKDTACQISSHPTLKSLKCSGFKEEDWTLFSDGLVPFKSVSSFDILDPTSAIICSIAKNSFDSSDLTLECRGKLLGNTPVDEKELYEAWSKCKCKTLKIRLQYDGSDSDQSKSLARSVLKGISVNRCVQHLDCQIPQLRSHGNHEENRDWLSLLKQLLVPRLTCHLRLDLSPAEWAAILCGVGGAEQLEKLDVCGGVTDDNTPVDEKELCEAWSQCKCKTVKMEIHHRTKSTQGGASLILSVLKEISVNGHVQHLVFEDPNPSDSLQFHGNHESHDWMSLLKQLLVLRLTCQLTLLLSPAEWAAILCGVGGAEQLEKLDVTMEFTDDNTPVDEKELCETWSQCKCKTVKMEIGYPVSKTQHEVSLLTGVLRGIAQNKTSVEFKLEFKLFDPSYYLERIPEDILTHFTRDGKTLTLNPLNSRCPTGGVSSGESPQTPGSNQTGEPSNKRRHIEQPPLVGVTDCSSSVLESTSVSPAQQVDHASRNVTNNEEDLEEMLHIRQQVHPMGLPGSQQSDPSGPRGTGPLPMESSTPLPPESSQDIPGPSCTGSLPMESSTPRPSESTRAGPSGSVTKFNVKSFMDKYKERFLKCVHTPSIATRLKVDHVIPEVLYHEIDERKITASEASGKLFLHLQSHAVLDTIHYLCDVMAGQNDYPLMKELGEDMKKDKDLPPSCAVTTPHAEEVSPPNTATTSQNRDIFYPVISDLEDDFSDLATEVLEIIKTLNGNKLAKLCTYLANFLKPKVPPSSPPPDVPETYDKLKSFLIHRWDPLQIRVLQGVVRHLKSEELSQQLKAYEEVMKEKIPAFLVKCKTKKVSYKRLIHHASVAVTINCIPSEVSLSRILELKEFFVSKLGLGEEHFEGFCGGSTVLYISIPEDSVWCLPACLHPSNLPQLEEWKVVSLSVEGMFTIDLVEKRIVDVLDKQSLSKHLDMNEVLKNEVTQLREKMAEMEKSHRYSKEGESEVRKVYRPVPGVKPDPVFDVESLESEPLTKKPKLEPPDYPDIKPKLKTADPNWELPSDIEQSNEVLKKEIFKLQEKIAEKERYSKYYEKGYSGEREVSRLVPIPRPGAGYHSDYSLGYPVHTPPTPQGPFSTEDLPGPSSLSYPPQYREPHPPYLSTHYSHPPTLSGGSGFDCRQFMEKYEDRFLQYVDSHAICNMLLLKGVIPSNLSHQLQIVDSTTGTQLVFLHLRSHADRDSLLKLCDVMINLTGYPNMSSLGRDMKRDLEQPVNTSTS